MYMAFKKFQNASTNISFDAQNNHENEGAERIVLSAFPSRETETKIVACSHSELMAGM